MAIAIFSIGKICRSSMETLIPPRGRIKARVRIVPDEPQADDAVDGTGLTLFFFFDPRQKYGPVALPGSKESKTSCVLMAPSGALAGYSAASRSHRQKDAAGWCQRRAIGTDTLGAAQIKQSFAKRLAKSVDWDTMWTEPRTAPRRIGDPHAG